MHKTALDRDGNSEPSAIGFALPYELIPSKDREFDPALINGTG
jgi:hypothetical protein